MGKSSNPTISVIVPVYNIEKYVKECINSILAQTYTNFEVIIVDDGSIDASGRIADEFALMDERVKVIHKRNGGLTSSRNAGLMAASGEWIMHVDGDDWIDPEMMAEMIAIADRKCADFVIGNLRFVCKGSNSWEYEMNDWNDDKSHSLNNYISRVWTSVCGCIAKKRLYDSYNLRSPEGISYCEDFHLAVRLCYYSDKVVHINKSYYNYRQQPHSIVHNLNKKTELDEQWVYQDTIRFFKEQDVYEDYRKVMSWRVLKSAQELLLDPTGHKRFMELFNEGKEYIFSCPFVNKKIKILAWLITHNLRPAVVMFDRMRSMIGR